MGCDHYLRRVAAQDLLEVVDEVDLPAIVEMRLGLIEEDQAVGVFPEQQQQAVATDNQKLPVGEITVAEESVSLALG